MIVAEFLVLVAMVHHQVVCQKLSGNSQPAALAETPPAGGQKFVTGRLSCRLEETGPHPEVKVLHSRLLKGAKSVSSVGFQVLNRNITQVPWLHYKAIGQDARLIIIITGIAI